MLPFVSPPVPYLRKYGKFSRGGDRAPPNAPKHKIGPKKNVPNAQKNVPNALFYTDPYQVRRGRSAPGPLFAKIVIPLGGKKLPPCDEKTFFSEILCELTHLKIVVLKYYVFPALSGACLGALWSGFEDGIGATRKVRFLTLPGVQDPQKLFLTGG